MSKPQTSQEQIEEILSSIKLGYNGDDDKPIDVFLEKSDYAEALAKIEERERLARIDELEFVLGKTSICAFHQVQGKIGNGMGCMCRSQLDFTGAVDRLSELQASLNKQGDRDD